MYNQCSIYSGKLSISNFECPPFDFLPLQGHLIIIHTCMPSIVLYVIHVDLYRRLQIKKFCPTCTIADRYT